MSVIFLEGFLDPDAERLHHGEVVEREEEGFLGGVEIAEQVSHWLIALGLASAALSYARR